jgi:tetratricopeptide (TPR) repeat protein
MTPGHSTRLATARSGRRKQLVLLALTLVSFAAVMLIKRNGDAPKLASAVAPHINLRDAYYLDLATLDEALDAAPTNVDYLLARASALSDSDDKCAPLPDLLLALEIAPYRADVLQRYGHTHAWISGESERPQDNVTLAAHLDSFLDPRTSTSANVLVRSATAEQCVTRGIELDAIGDTRGAIREFTRAVRYYPTVEANARLGLCYFRMREYRWCERMIFSSYHYEDGRYDSKLRANALWASGWCQLATGNTDAAFHNLCAALEPDPRFNPKPNTQATPSP